MKLVGRYFVLKLKSCIKAFGKSAAGLFFVIVLLIVGVLGISFGFQNEQILQKVKVAMVIPESETLINKGVQFLSAMDSIESICEFYYMEEEDAKEALEDGDLQVVIILPVNFYEDVYSGDNTPAEILMAEGKQTNYQVFEELLTTGVSYLQISEAGVYAVLDGAKGESTLMGRTKIGDFVAQKYITTLFDRMDVYEEKTVSSFGIVDFGEYALIMLLLFMLLLVGTNFSVLYQENEKAVERKLRAEGVSPLVLSLTKVAIIAICLWALWTVAYSGICVVCSMLELEILWWDISCIIYGFVLAVSVAAFYHLVYELSGNGAQGSILLLFVNIGMLLCSGIILPSSYLHDAVAFLGKCTPVALWNTYIQQFMFDSVTVELLFTFILVTIVEILLGAVVVWKEA
ncbi:MAG: ABC transporter permease [Agathobacter sp.]|nr:ABC transporter permease [Agathobacter sp.]